MRDITIRHDLHALSTFFKYGIKQRWTRENPIRNVKIPSDAGAVRIHVISPEEEKEYFKRAARNQNLYDLSRLIRNQGMRPEEVISLRKADIDLDRGQLHIRAGKSKAARRTLDLTSESRSILAARCKSKSMWIFPSDRISGVCHEHERELVMLYQRWETASRSRLAGAGFKLPSAAAFKRRGSERLRKRRPARASGEC